jgi:hypothetical protein
VVTINRNRARRAVGHSAGRAVVLAAFAVGLASCDVTPAASPSASPVATPLATTEVLAYHDWLKLGPYGVGDLGCDGQELAWSSGSQPISKQNSLEDVIRVANQSEPTSKVIAFAKHGGTLTDVVAVTGAWVVYMEYQQHGQGSSVDFWYLTAVDWANGNVLQLASATSGLALQELPWYDASGGKAVWDQLDSNGAPVLHMYDFAAGQTTTLPIPAAMYPVQPAISGNSVVFVDNSTDPDRGHEDFLSRRGTLRRFDVTKHDITTLSTDSSAWMPRARGGDVIWTAMPGQGPSALLEVRLDGGGISTLGSNPVAPLTDGSRVVWYDSHALRFITYGLRTHHTTDLQIGTWQDMRSVFALCGSRLFFALPEAIEGSSTLRYADLSGAEL